jgi:hypothetical protein
MLTCGSDDAFIWNESREIPSNTSHSVEGSTVSQVAQHPGQDHICLSRLEAALHRGSDPALRPGVAYALAEEIGIATEVPVVDFAVGIPEVNQERLVLIGRSFGGYLAPRAAAFEHRLAAVIADPGQFDEFDLAMARMPQENQRVPLVIRLHTFLPRLQNNTQLLHHLQAVGDAPVLPNLALRYPLHRHALDTQPLACGRDAKELALMGAF